MKKTAKTKKPTPLIPLKTQWLIVALMVVVLFAFACIVYAADLMWNSSSL